MVVLKEACLPQLPKVFQPKYFQSLGDAGFQLVVCYLPDVKVPGERAPLVSTKKDGNSLDYSTYLDAKGDADIFFPTDFWLLERMDHYCSRQLKPNQDKSLKKGKKRRTLMLDTSSFMEEFGLPSKTRTKDGYNPLLDDFKNTKFYLSVPTHNTK